MIYKSNFDKEDYQQPIGLEPKPQLNNPSQGEINSILLINALRLLGNDHRDYLCISLFERSETKIALMEKLQRCLKEAEQ